MKHHGSFEQEVKKYTNYSSINMDGKMIILPAEDRLTSDFMTLAEYTEVISTRAKQIEQRQKIFVDPPRQTPEATAIAEIMEKQCPLAILRQHSNGEYEKISVNELSIPAYIRPE